MNTVLTIQSHVAYGYVGNRAAVFPLQRLGFDAIAVNTVQFSNHTGYGAWTGEVFSAGHITGLIDGLDQLGVLPGCQAVLSGYMGDPALGQVIVDTVARVKAANPAAIYCCDPVMGDVGRGFFVRPGLPEFIRDTAVPVADILTPNQFELEFLTGRTIHRLDDALAAAALLRVQGPRMVLVTSLTREDAPSDTIEMLAAGDDGCWLISTPRLALSPLPNGSGDAVAALFLAHWLKSGGNAVVALEQSAAAIYAIFAKTRELGTRELQLIAAQNDLVAPPQHFQATRVA